MNVIWILVGMSLLLGGIKTAHAFFSGIFDARRRAAELDQFRQLSHPVVVASETEFDSTVMKRAERIRALIVESENKWLTENDVYAIPFGGVYKTLSGSTESLYGQSWPQYRQKCAELEHRILASFQLKIANAPNGGINTANKYTAGQQIH